MSGHLAGWVRAAGLATMLAAALPSIASSQAAAPAPLDVPTTRLLAIGSFTAKGTPDKWKPLLQAEVKDTVRLYLAGKIDQWFLKQDQSGVVFLMNLADPAEARELLAKLPFGQAGVMQFELIPLGPIAPLRVLLNDPPK